jgi:transcriptional regulator with XRE-family HTH domain
MTDNDDFQKRLIARRAEMEWSQEDLSRESGVAAAQISRYESGKSKPRPNVIKKLSTALMVPFDWLAYGNESMFKLSSPEEQMMGTLIHLELPEEVSKYVTREAVRLGVSSSDVVLRILTEIYSDRSKQ